MVAEDFLQDPQVRQWLDGVEPTWTLLTFDSLRAVQWRRNDLLLRARTRQPHDKDGRPPDGSGFRLDVCPSRYFRFRIG